MKINSDFAKKITFRWVGPYCNETIMITEHLLNYSKFNENLIELNLKDIFNGSNQQKKKIFLKINRNNGRSRKISRIQCPTVNSIFYSLRKKKKKYCRQVRQSTPLRTGETIHPFEHR